MAAPLLRHGYHQALVLGALLVVAAAIAAGLLRIGYPHRLPAPTPATTPITET
ncbi:hypothetical protein AB0L13_44795 [Saccharopolyspora shandongensis]